MSDELQSAREEVDAIMSRINADALKGFGERLMRAFDSVVDCHMIPIVHLPPEGSASELETARAAYDELAALSAIRDQRADEALASADALAVAAESLLVEMAGLATPFSRHLKALAAASDDYRATRECAR